MGEKLDTKYMLNYQQPLIASINLFTGMLGGAASVFVGQPLDTIKVKMQTFPKLYSSAYLCFKETLLKERICGLYSGTVPSLIANCSENAVLFCSFGLCQNVVTYLAQKKDIKDLNSFQNACAGSMAAFFTAFALCPTEMIKCKLQAMREMKLPPKGPLKLTKIILKEEGLQGFFRGIGVTIAREMVGYFFFFGAYDFCKTLVTPKGKTKDNVGLFGTIVSGGIGGVTFWLAIFPSDVIKSRMQVMGTQESALTITRGIIQKEGVKYLYKGLGPSLVRTFPATGTLFVVYEYSKSYLHYILGISELKSFR